MAWFTAKEWKNRLVEFAGRRSLKNVSTSETTVYDVTRNEGQVSQEGDSFSATTMNDLEQRISDAFAEAEEASEFQNLKTYTALSQLGLSAPVTMEQIYSQMPSSSFFIMGVEGTGDISNLPENDTYGIIEIFKRDRNFARFTSSLSSAMAGSMFYGTFSWSGRVAFTGWKRIIDDKRLANNLTTTAEGYGLDARQGKVLMDKANQLISDLGGCQITTEGSGESTKYFIQRGADSASKKELGVEPSTLRLRLYGRAYSYIPTYGKNIRVTRWENSGNGTSGVSFYGADSIGGEVGDALTHLDPSANNEDYTIECEAFKYIAFESKNAPSGSFNIQIDYI